MFAFVDVCAIPGHGTTLASIDDDAALIPPVAPTTQLRFPVRMFDASPTNPALTVSSNGWLSLYAVGRPVPMPSLPSNEDPNLTIAAYWRDLATRADGVCYATLGAALDRRFVAEWSDAQLRGDATSHRTFERAIDEAPLGVNNVIDLVYRDVIAAGPTSPPPGVGIEDHTGTVAQTYAPPPTSGLAVRFTPMVM